MENPLKFDVRQSPLSGVKSPRAPRKPAQAVVRARIIPVAEHRPPSADGSPAMTRAELSAGVAAATSLTPSPGARQSPLRASGSSPPGTARHERSAILRPARPWQSPPAACPRSRPARLCATPSMNREANAVARDPRPVVDVYAAQADTSIGALRFAGSETPALPCRLRLADRRSDPRSQRPPAIRVAPSAVGSSSAPRRPGSATFVAGRRRGDFGDPPHVRTHAQARAEIESHHARVHHKAGQKCLLRQCCAPLRSSRNGSVA